MPRFALLCFRYLPHVLGLLLWLPGGAVETRAQPAVPPREPIGSVRVDAQGDFVPDRLGQTVTVAGRASVGSQTLLRSEYFVFLQDATGGLLLGDGQSGLPEVAEGDSLIATGVVDQRYGLTYLRTQTLRVVPGERVAPAPRAIEADLAAFEAAEGRVVEARGMIVARDSLEVGDYFLLLIDDVTVNVFVFRERATPLSLGRFHVGDYLKVRGILGQFDRTEPYNTGYQLYPRRPDDLSLAGFPPTLYRNVALGVVALLLLTLGWVWTLKGQVRLRVRQLQATEKRYETLFRLAGDPVLVHTPTGRLIEANQQAKHLLSFSETTQQLADLAETGDHLVLADHLRRVHSQESARSELRLRTRRPAAQMFEVQSHALVLNGETRILSIARDITDRKAYEQALLDAKQEAETLARSKSTFLANMSHEIRTPLTAVLGFAELLRVEVDEHHREYVALIEEGGRRLLATLNSVLDLARLDAGRLQLNMTTCDLAQVVRGGVQLLQPLALQRGIWLHTALDVETLPICLDASAFDRILTNLVGNAIKFTENGDVRVHLAADAERVTLKVEDTGIGIEAAFLPHLFDEFRQESTGFERSHEGSGLGLAITKRLLTLMGGSLSVDSEKGVGTTFTVVLPRHPEAQVNPGHDWILQPEKVVKG